MWIWLAVGSAFMLGLYDVAKKHSLRRNDSLVVLVCSTALTALFLCPWLSAGSLHDHSLLWLKAVLVSLSWVSGMEALKTLPLTTASTLKASRPVFVLLFSVVLFGERLNAWQWAGSVIAIVSLYLLSVSSKKEGIDFRHHKGVAWMVVSILSGVASALYDKHIMKILQPLFVQSWTNVYITLLLAAVILVRWLSSGKSPLKKFRWDWTIVLIAVFITVADALYFFSLREEDALLSVISMIRRSSVTVAFAAGAILFKEGNIKSKAADMLILLASMAIIVFGSTR